MFAVNAEDIHRRLTVGPVEAQVFDTYVPIRAVTMLGLEHVVLWIGSNGGSNVIKRNTDLVAIR